jgi:hypothetical protein
VPVQFVGPPSATQPAIGLWLQPEAGSQASAVHGSPSLQSWALLQADAQASAQLSPAPIQARNVDVDVQPSELFAIRQAFSPPSRWLQHTTDSEGRPQVDFVAVLRTL